MGLRAQCRRITSAQLDELRSNPGDIGRFIDGAFAVNADQVRSTLEKVQQIGLYARASGLLNNLAERKEVRDRLLKELAKVGVGLPNDASADDISKDGLNLEKSWHVLHYLLTGDAEESPPPLGNAILGGHEIGEERDYGRARFLTPPEVAEVAAALAQISKDELGRRFDLKAMKAAQIYAARDASDLELAQMYFDRLSRYYRDATTAQDGMLLWIE
jgi:hypothetical protein